MCIIYSIFPFMKYIHRIIALIIVNSTSSLYQTAVSKSVYIIEFLHIDRYYLWKIHNIYMDQFVYSSGQL